MQALPVAALAVLLAAVVKGTIGIGFPTLATPLLTLVLDVKTAVVLLILPNIVMDGIQFTRQGVPVATMRRLTSLIIFGALGTVLGTRLLVELPAHVVLLVLGVFLLVFVALNVARMSPRIPAGWEPWVAPVAGLVAGVLGGVTNVPGTPLAVYFYALGMEKREFIRAVAFTFLVYKLVQLGAVAYYGLLTWSLLLVSAGLTAVAVTGFAGGLLVQDRLEQRAFNRLILIFLAGLGLWLVLRATRG
ncbi:MAG TPA: sulfite exporter TauE/SafE family protein [Methylomirabilota bacterium]|nr:sulfite exporter TauE/SafE family protein [Methylomirabilota bacterium]